jgi:hypothetical protein
MNSAHISSILTRDPYARQYFRGVFPRDDLIISPSGEETLYVCNLDECDQPGSHWIAINKIGTDVFYFDSYGLPPVFDDLIEKMMTASCETLTWNAVRLQGFDSVVCGHYCVVYCLLKSRQRSNEEIISLLLDDPSMDTHTRDHAVHAAVTSAFPSILSDNNINIHNTQMFY